MRKVASRSFFFLPTQAIDLTGMGVRSHGSSTDGINLALVGLALNGIDAAEEPALPAMDTPTAPAAPARPVDPSLPAERPSPLPVTIVDTMLIPRQHIGR